MRRLAFLAAALVAPAAVTACDPDYVVHHVGWFATMRHQRSIKPYARPIPPVPGTVPVTGAEPAVDLRTADRLVNPRTRTSESINRGRFVYETYCLGGGTTAGTSSTTCARSRWSGGAGEGEGEGGADERDERGHGRVA